MAASASEGNGGKAFYGYLFVKSKPIPRPTPVLDALLRAIASYIVRMNLKQGCKSMIVLTLFYANRQQNLMTKLRRT